MGWGSVVSAPSFGDSWFATVVGAAASLPSMLRIATLRLREEPADVRDENTPVRAALRYLGNRSDPLDYARALALDLPVGSGLIESGHRHVLQACIKKAGAWWTEANAHALCQLRTSALRTRQ